MSIKDKRIAVLGAGSWGTALAVQSARAGRKTSLWGRVEDGIEQVIEQRTNEEYLPGVEFPMLLTASKDLEDVVARSHDIMIAVPSFAFRSVLEQIAPLLEQHQRICWATKGFEVASGLLPHQVAEEVLTFDCPKAVLSGPSFAKEVGAGLPTAITIAASKRGYAKELAIGISSDRFRAFTSVDMIGVEIGGATKNVFAIGAGISDGLGFGANARVAMITRALAEMMQLGEALGAQQKTLAGLAGMGDLVLTCTDDLSRNRRFGLALASGKTKEEAETEIKQVVEGTHAARAVRAVAQQLGLEMPITEQIYRILYEGLDPRDAVNELMQRELTAE